MSDKIPVLFIVGPTAVGKTDFAIQLAKKLDGEIVSADSRYFYRGMDIGTAKPTPEEQQGVSHHLIDVADPDETWSLALFQREADAAIRDIDQRGKLPIVAGGTGQYVRAVLEGWSVPEGEPDLRLRDAIEAWGKAIGSAELHHKLSLIDPKAAEKIDWQNTRRTIRALEVIFSSGRRFSEQRAVKESPYMAVVIGLTREREELYQRIDLRVDQMIQKGFVEETAALLAKGYDPELPAMSAIGYKEICAYIKGETSLEEAAQLIKFRTHAYVRRQANWFKKDDPQIHWINLSEGERTP